MIALVIITGFGGMVEMLLLMTQAGVAEINRNLITPRVIALVCTVLSSMVWVVMAY